jgi:hypothetical protein
MIPSQSRKREHGDTEHNPGIGQATILGLGLEPQGSVRPDSVISI